MLPKGIMFDLDDTILAYSPVVEPTWRTVCETYADQEDGEIVDLNWRTVKLKSWERPSFPSSLSLSLSSAAGNRCQRSAPIKQPPPPPLLLSPPSWALSGRALAVPEAS